MFFKKNFQDLYQAIKANARKLVTLESKNIWMHEKCKFFNILVYVTCLHAFIGLRDITKITHND